MKLCFLYIPSSLAWPGDIYIEDINAESDFKLIQTIMEKI